MGAVKKSGQSPLVFVHREDLRTLPSAAMAQESKLHGGFAVDHAGDGAIYYGMPGCGLMRVHADLSAQDILPLPAELQAANFHSTKLGEFDGKRRLIMPANNDELVAIFTLEGNLDFILPRPIFEEYQTAETAFRPTDTVLAEERLYVADGYGANYIALADSRTQRWTDLFGGKVADVHDHHGFGTAHGITLLPTEEKLIIADRPHSRLEVYTYAGEFERSYGLPAGSRPCGIDYIHWQGRWLAAVGSLDAPEAGRPAPIYILDGMTHTLLSTVRPKEDLGIEQADHLHNVVWHSYRETLFLICQSWNPGFYFVLALVESERG